MNVLIMADYRTPNSGNFIASLLELAQRMTERGDGVFFLFPENRRGGGYSWSRWLEENGFSVELMRDGSTFDERISVIRKLIQQHKIEIVHTHFDYCNKLLIRYHKELGVRVLIHDHMDYSPEGNICIQKIRVMAYAMLCRIHNVHVVSVMERRSSDK